MRSLTDRLIVERILLLTQNLTDIEFEALTDTTRSSIALAGTDSTRDILNRAIARLRAEQAQRLVD